MVNRYGIYVPQMSTGMSGLVTIPSFISPPNMNYHQMLTVSNSTDATRGAGTAYCSTSPALYTVF